MSKKQIKTNKQMLSLVKNAIVHFIFCSKNDLMTDEIFKVFLNSVSLNHLDDNTILKSSRIRKLIDWNRINKRQKIRLISRDPSLIKEFNLSFSEYSITELEMFLRFHPEYANDLNIDFDKITPRECLILLNIDVDICEFIDFSKLHFTRIEMQQLIKKFSFEDRIIKNINFDLLDNYLKRMVLKKTKMKYVSKIKFEDFGILDWEDLIKKNPEFLNIFNPDYFPNFNLEIFTKGDCSSLINLAGILPGAYDLIEKNKHKISSYGWEKLLFLDYEKYSMICDWEKLNNLSFKILKKKYPDIEKFKVS